MRRFPLQTPPAADGPPRTAWLPRAAQHRSHPGAAHRTTIAGYGVQPRSALVSVCASLEFDARAGYTRINHTPERPIHAQLLQHLGVGFRKASFITSPAPAQHRPIGRFLLIG